MSTLPDLRHNLGTWAVVPPAVPAVAAAMLRSLPAEPFDPSFRGQHLETTYFDTRDFDLRNARRRGEKYLTLRVRCYQQDRDQFYALSAKTEAEKFRLPIQHEIAEDLLDDPNGVTYHLPSHLLARLYELAGHAELVPVVTVACRRYAVEDEAERLTLDVWVQTDTGKHLLPAILEFKSMQKGSLPPAALAVLGLRPIKVSKFLWSTLWR